MLLASRDEMVGGALDEASSRYLRLSPGSAQRALRFWQRKAGGHPQFPASCVDLLPRVGRRIVSRALCLLRHISQLFWLSRVNYVKSGPAFAAGSAGFV